MGTFSAESRDKSATDSVVAAACQPAACFDMAPSSAFSARHDPSDVRVESSINCRGRLSTR